MFHKIIPKQYIGCKIGNLENTLVMSNLGWYYENGQIVPKNQQIADLLLAARDAAESVNKEETIKLVKQVIQELEKLEVDLTNPPIVQIVQNSIYFIDNSGNNAIDADEQCKLISK